jgi:hypothetical protein
LLASRAVAKLAGESMNADAGEIRPEQLPPAIQERPVAAFPWFVASAITLAAVWLHLTLLAHGGALWRDEVNLVNLAALPGLAGLQHDSFPVAMPLVVRAWSGLGFGKTDFGLRCLGALVGLGLLGAYWTASWSTRRAPPLLSLALLALNATALTYGDALRAYGLGSLLIVLAMAATGRFLARPSPARLACMAALMVASVQTLFHNAVLVGALCAGALVVCLLRKSYREALFVLGAGLAAAASLLPYLATVVSALNPAAGWSTKFRPGFAWLDLRRVAEFPRESYLWLWALLIVLSLIFGASAGARLWIRRQPPAPGGDPTPRRISSPPGDQKAEPQLFAAVTLVVALAGFAAFLWYAELSTQPWYFLPLLALAVACLDAVLAPTRRYPSLAVLAFAAGTALTAFPLARVEMLQRFTNVDVIAHVLAREAAPADYIVVSPWFCGISFARYYHGPAPWTTLPPLEDHQFHRFDLVSAKLQHPDAIQPVLDRSAATLQSGHRVWLAGWVDVPPPGRAPPPNLPRPPLKGWGWSQTPYTINWSDQLEALLSGHSREFQFVSLPPCGDVNANEELKLVRAAGWSP